MRFGGCLVVGVAAAVWRCGRGYVDVAEAVSVWLRWWLCGCNFSFVTVWVVFLAVTAWLPVAV